MFQLWSSEPASNDVLITGLGMVTPFGIGRERSWQRLLNGDTAGRRLTASDIDHFQQLSDLMKRVPGGAPVDHAAVAAHIQESALRHSWDDRIVRDFSHDCLNNMILAALDEAIVDAGIGHDLPTAERIGCVIGSSKASLRTMEAEFASSRAGTAEDQSRWLNAFLPDAPLRCVQATLNAAGPSLCPVAACASGLISVIQGAYFIRNGLCDVCVVGSADASLRASVLASFHRLGVASKGVNPQTSCKPFDRDRDGFILGEGGAVMVLESRAYAERRRATAYGQVTSAGWLTDPTGMTQIDSSGTIVSELLSRTCTAASPPDVISLHGTGTETNDLAEACGVSRTLGNDSAPCFGIKGAVGHLLGAAGSVEFALMLLAMRNQVVPGTANLQALDEECRLNVSAKPMSRPLSTGLKLSLGFGGHVAACGVERAEDRK